MWQKICSFIFHRLLGWKSVVTVPAYKKCVIIAAPHTSNWDFLIGELFYGSIGRRASFMMKREWFFFPLGLLFRAIGGIPIDRRHNRSMVRQMVERFRRSDYFNLCITPEATRKANPDWKTGFYHISLQADVPILLAGIDYPSKTIYMVKTMRPIGNVEYDMHNVKSYFKSFRGRNPKNFDLGKY